MSLFKKVGRRGVTLVELVIVLALMGILSVVIVSLTSTISSIVGNSTEMSDNIEKITLSREFIENWFYSFDSSENEYIIENNKLIIVSENKEYKIYVDDEKNICVDYPDASLNNNSRPTKYEFSNIVNLKFENYEKTRLYICYIIYIENENEKTFSFVLGRRS